MRCIFSFPFSPSVNTWAMSQRYQLICSTQLASYPLYHLPLPLLNCAQNWQIEFELESRDGGWISITGSRKAAWREGVLIGSGDPVQPLRTGWHQVSTVNYSAPSEHQGQEHLAQIQAQHMHTAIVTEFKRADKGVMVFYLKGHYKTLHEWSVWGETVAYQELFSHLFRGIFFIPIFQSL